MADVINWARQWLGESVAAAAGRVLEQRRTAAGRSLRQLLRECGYPIDRVACIAAKAGSYHE